MLDQNTFTETIRAVQDIIRTSAEPMTREEILSYFKDMDLNAQQEEMVLEFLSTPHDDPQPEENEPETKEAEYEETAEKEETKESSAKKESAKDSVTDNISTSPMFQMYLEELKDIPEYTKEQQIDMYKKLAGRGREHGTRDIQCMAAQRTGSSKETGSFPGRI